MFRFTPDVYISSIKQIRGVIIYEKIDDIRNGFRPVTRCLMADRRVPKYI